EIQLLNLFTLRQERSWRFDEVIRRIAFSSDGNRLLLLGSGSNPSLLLAREDYTVTGLPLLEPLPEFDGVMEWRRNSEVVFYRAGKPALVLNLGTLLVDESSKLTLEPNHCDGKAMRFTARLACHAAENPPPKGAVPDWQTCRSPCLAMTHAAKGLVRLFPDIELHQGE